MRKLLKGLFYKSNHVDKLMIKNRERFVFIIADNQINYLESVYKRLFDSDNSLTDEEILIAYNNFSEKIQTNTFSAAELEWVIISVLCYYRPALTEILLRRPLLAIVYSLGDDIDWFTVGQFIDKRILAEKVEPYGGLPPNVGQDWLKQLLPAQKETVQKVLLHVIEENKRDQL